MREILFRGKRIDNGEWLEGWYQPPVDYKSQLDGTSLHFGVTIAYKCKEGWLDEEEVNPSTVGQYTGRTDKNGVKIFEGDCIRISDYEEIGVICYGKYRQPCDDCCGGHIGFYVDWVTGVSKELFRKDLGYWADKVEIIGNIHDNPELLKGGGGNG